MEPENYRSVSLPSVPGKLVDIVIKVRTIRHIENFHRSGEQATLWQKKSSILSVRGNEI